MKPHVNAMALLGLALLAPGAGCNNSGSAPAASSAAPAAPAAKARATINGKSISEAEMNDVDAALKKAGWKYAGGSGMTMGATKNVTVKGEKGSDKAAVSIIRPSGKAESGSGMKMASAKDQEADFAAKGATYFENDVLVAVVVEGKKDEAKKLLDAVLQR